MLLVLDIGNSNVVAGVYEGDVFINSWRIHTEWDKTSDEYGTDLVGMFQHAGMDPKAVEGIIMSSVVPPITRTIENMCYKFFGRRPIRASDVNHGIHIRYDNPEELGTDRLLNVIAAQARYGTPCIVVDFGTATTFSAMDTDGSFVGGPICPGIRNSSAALFHKSAMLTWIDLKRPEHVINRNTIANMQAGISYGYIGMVDYIVRKMKEEMGWAEAKIIATGGMSVLIGPESEMIQYTDSKLTLDGLRILYMQVKGESDS